MTVAVLLIASYLVGSIPFGVVIGWMRGFDPRSVGSANIGMTNVARAGGRGAAAMTLIGDTLKGAVPVAFARRAGFGPEIAAWTGLAAFAGAICSVFLKFRGGKGVSAALGVWAALAPGAIAISLAMFAVVLAAFRIMSLASLSAAIVLPSAVAALGLPRPYLLLAIVMSALVVFRHHENMRRLLSGTEPRLGLGTGKRDAA